MDNFGVRVLGIVRKMVPTTYGCYNEVNTRQQRGSAVADPLEFRVDNSEWIWDLLLRENPLIEHYSRTGGWRGTENFRFCFASELP